MARAQTAGPAADPFAYLIPQYGPKALAWSKQQTDATRARLEASPTFKAVLADMKAVHASEKPLPTYWLLGGHRYIRLEHDKSHPYGIIATADGGCRRSAGAWRTVFDLDAYNRTVPHPYTIKWLQPESECLAPADDRCMIPLWYEGGQDNAYVELDLNTGRLVKNGFQIAPGRNEVAWIDRDTLLVAHTTEGARVMPSQFPAELHVWKRGTPLSRAPKIFELQADRLPVRVRCDRRARASADIRQRGEDLHEFPAQGADARRPHDRLSRCRISSTTSARRYSCEASWRFSSPPRTRSTAGRIPPIPSLPRSCDATSERRDDARPPGVYLSGGFSGFRGWLRRRGCRTPAAHPLSRHTEGERLDP